MIIRWSTLLPRLVLLTFVVAGLWFVRDRVIQWQIQSQIANQTGAAARIGSVQSEPAKGTVQINDIVLYDPQSPKRELFRAEKIIARGNPNDLAVRFLRFPEVQLEGIQIVVDGTDGRELVPDKLWTKLKDRLPQEIGSAAGWDWTELLTSDPDDAAKNFLKQLESTRLAGEIKDRWPKEVAEFEKQAESIRSRFQNIKNLFSKSNQIQDKLLLAQEVLKELEGTDQGIQQLIAAAAQLKGKAQQDYQSLLQASQKDKDSLKQLQKPTFNTEKLAESLIGSEIREQWNKTVAWGDWVRTLLTPPESGDDPPAIYDRFGLKPPKRLHGEQIHFSALKARSELLVEKTSLTGQILFGTLPVFFNGVVDNIAEPMSLGPEPIVAQFCFSGSGIPKSPIPPADDEIASEQVPAVLNPGIVPNLYAKWTMDRIGDREEDLLTIRCPMYQLPERTIGNPEKWSLTVSPGISQLDGVVRFQGENLAGRIVFFQNGVRIDPVFPEKLRQSPLERIFRETLGAIHQFVAEIHVGGTRSNPSYMVKSNLAEQLRPRLETLLASEWDSIRRKTELAVNAEANQAITLLNQATQQGLDPVLKEIETQRTAFQQQAGPLNGTSLDLLLQSQKDKLSPQDRQRLNNLMGSPLVQALVPSGENPAPPGQQPSPAEHLLQQGAEKLQEKLPGWLDKLKKR